MKRSLLNRPVFVLPIAFEIAALLARTGWRLHSENELLRAARAQAPSLSQSAIPQSASTPPPASKDETSARTRLAELRAELEKETAARTAMETKATELAAKLPTKEGDIVVSFGRIEQMGQASAKLVRIFTSDAFRKLTTGKPDAGELPEEQQREMMDAFQKHLGQIPELQRMEDNPGKIARYQAALLQDVYGLDEATARKVNTMLEAEFAKLKASGLTVSQRTEAEKAS